MKKLMLACAGAAVLVGAGAAPASATFDSGGFVAGVSAAAARPAGVCVTYGSIPVATVYDPLRPGSPLVIVSAPTVSRAYFC